MAESKLKIDVRRNKILEQLKLDGKVSVSRLAAELGATPVTIRNDLTALEQDGYLVRMQGGAVIAPRLENHIFVFLTLGKHPAMIELSNERKWFHG